MSEEEREPAYEEEISYEDLPLHRFAVPIGNHIKALRALAPTGSPIREELEILEDWIAAFFVELSEHFYEAWEGNRERDQAIKRLFQTLLARGVIDLGEEARFETDSLLELFEQALYSLDLQEDILLPMVLSPEERAEYEEEHAKRIKRYQEELEEEERDAEWIGEMAEAMVKVAETEEELRELWKREYSREEE